MEPWPPLKSALEKSCSIRRGIAHVSSDVDECGLVVYAKYGQGRGNVV